MTSCSGNTGCRTRGPKPPNGISFYTQQRSKDYSTDRKGFIYTSPMNTHLRLLCLILVTAAFAIGQEHSNNGSAAQSQARPQRQSQQTKARCTKQALAALKSIPKLTYECTDDSDDEIQQSPGRRAALKDYLPKLESAAGPGFWAASAGDLNACAIRNNERAKTPEDQLEIDSNPRVLGDGSTRLILLLDPCVKYSYITQNGFILQRAGGRVYSSQVLDAFYSRLDPGVELQLARHNGKTVVVVETNSEPMMNTLFSTFHLYSIDPGTHRAVPMKLFMNGGKLTNEFEFDEYLFDDELTMRRWHAPQLVHNGRLSPRFTVYTMKKDQDQEADGSSKFSRKTYVWNGRYYKPERRRSL